jgi:hypothetical protein
MKSGYQTTEFWLTLGAAIAATTLAHFEKVEGTTAIAVTGVLTAIYTILRAALKNKATG